MANNERRVSENHPSFGTLYDLANRIAQTTNPQIFFDGAKAQEEGEDTQPEWKAEVQKLKDSMTDELQGGIFRDAVEDIQIRKRVSPKR